MKVKHMALALAVAAMLSGCTMISREGEVRLERYTLINHINPKAYDLNYDIKVALAPILNQGGVVMQISDVELRPAKNHRYSASLREELRLLIVDEIAKRKPALGKYQYRAFISKFQGDVDGKVHLAMYIKVSNPRNNKVLYEQSFNKEQVLTTDGYQALVEDLKSEYLEILTEVLDSIEGNKQKK